MIMSKNIIRLTKNKINNGNFILDNLNNQVN